MEADSSKGGARLGIGQARFSDLLRGNISEFDIDEMVILADRAGLKVSVEIRDAAYTARGRGIGVMAVADVGE